MDAVGRHRLVPSVAKRLNRYIRSRADAHRRRSGTSGATAKFALPQVQTSSIQRKRGAPRERNTHLSSGTLAGGSRIYTVWHGASAVGWYRGALPTLRRPA